MATPVPPSQHPTSMREDLLPPKNILKSKPNNEPPPKPQSKHGLSE